MILCPFFLYLPQTLFLSSLLLYIFLLLHLGSSSCSVSVFFSSIPFSTRRFCLVYLSSIYFLHFSLINNIIYSCLLFYLFSYSHLSTWIHLFAYSFRSLTVRFSIILHFVYSLPLFSFNPWPYISSNSAGSFLPSLDFCLFAVLSRVVTLFFSFFLFV